MRRGAASCMDKPTRIKDVWRLLDIENDGGRFRAFVFGEGCRAIDFGSPRGPLGGAWEVISSGPLEVAEALRALRA